MPFTIQGQDVAAVPDTQSPWYETDIAILVAGIAGTGVLTDCEVTAQGSPDMTVAVASGTIQPSVGVAAVTVTGANKTITTADGTDPRIDLVSASAAGVLTVTDGTAAAAPKPPALPSGHIALAMVDVPANDTTIGTAQITDKRAMVFAPSVGGGAAGVDAVPTSPSAYDEEFKATPSGWSDLGTLDSFDITDIPGWLHVKKTATGSFTVSGKYKATPSTPFFMWWKVPDMVYTTAYMELGVMLAGAAPGSGPLFIWGGLAANGNLGYAVYDTPTHRATWGGDRVANHRYLYYGILVTSTTNIATYVSDAGIFWQTIETGINPGFTIANFGPFVCGQDNSVLVDGVIQYIRFRAAV